MFDAFQSGSPSGTKTPLPFFMGAAVLLYAGAAVAIGFLSVPGKEPPAPKEIEVSLKAPPKPPTAPVVVPPPAVPPPPTQQKKTAPQPNTPPPPPKPVQPLVAPKEISDAKLTEADPVPAASLMRSDSLIPDGAAPTVSSPAPPPVIESPPRPPPSQPNRSIPIELPEDAELAEPSENNVPPEFPEEARAKGIEGKVVLKIVISEKGLVTSIQVLKGEEPFVTAAKNAVRNWRYTPARIDGEATASYRIVPIPFVIKR